jgi:LacI family transcriptional regulator
MLPHLKQGQLMKSTGVTPPAAQAHRPLGLRHGSAAKERHILFLGDLCRHSEREVCVGAAEYAAERLSWVFDPCPMVLAPPPPPALPRLQSVSGVLTTERAMQHIRRWRFQFKAPVVYYLADQAHPEADAVGIDEVAVGEMAAEHLWSRGYRRFAFIGSSDWAWSNARGQGFARWLALRGEKPQIHLFSSDLLPVFWSEDPARRHECLQGLIRCLPTPCGVFTANDVIACFVVQAARHQRCRVPEDLGVVGVDNDPFPNAAAGVAITSIELPFREMGRQAARLLDQSSQDRSVRKSLPPVRVVVRVSSDAFMTLDALVRKAQSFIEAHRHRHCAVGDVTRAVGSNRTTLGKRFQRELGVTLHEYLRRRRLAYALERLRQGDASVERVASECGFSSASYFSHVFTQSTGRRPGSVRRARLGSVTQGARRAGLRTGGLTKVP